MAFPKFHGITLANGSVIENLHVERLAADPTPATAGRIWVNTTEKAIKFTGLDAGGAVVVHAFASAAELTAGVDSAKSYTDSQITALKGLAPDLLNTLDKIAAALNNDPNVYNTLTTLMASNIEAAKVAIRGEVSTSFDTLAELEAGLSAEQAARAAGDLSESNARTAADTALQNNISALDGQLASEAAARAAGDTALDGRVTTVEGQVNGKIGALTALATDAKNTIVAAVNEVDSHVDAEVARAVAAEAQLATDLAAEVTARAAADAAQAATQVTQAGQIATMSTDAAALSAALAAEVSRATTAESTLQTSIETLTTGLGGGVAAEATARAGGDASIRSAVNAGKFTFTASAGALTHVVAHGLNTSPVLVSVYVEGDDGKYRNDIVAVEETNNNTITIGLTESRKVKVAVLSMASI